MDDIEEWVGIYDTFEEESIFEFGLGDNKDNPQSSNDVDLNEDGMIQDMMHIGASPVESAQLFKGPVVHVDQVEVSTDNQIPEPPKRGRGRPRSQLNEQQKKERQKLINKKSAVKYREKKKSLNHTIDDRFEEVKAHNISLIATLNAKIAEKRRLISDIKAKGIKINKISIVKM